MNVVNGQVYKFKYHNQVRVALCTDADEQIFWDFTNDGYRCFLNHKRFNTSNVTHLCIISQNESAFDKYPEVHSHVFNGRNYGVRFKHTSLSQV